MNRIPLIKPYIDYNEVESSFKQIFESGWFTKGKFVAGFKDELCAYTNAKYALPATSATTALYACLKVLGIGCGDEVVVSDFSFPASCNVIEEIGATPIFADVSLETYNMLPQELESKITDRTKAVMFVDALGNPSGLDKISKICKAKSIPLIEDAACAIGSTLNGVKCGNISDLSCFSFHPRKLLTCGEGGAITTNNEAYAAQLEILLNHGAKVENGKFDFVEAGYNFRMTEMQAAMGISQLKKLDSIVDARIKTRAEYDSQLEPLGFIAQKVADGVRHNVQSLVYRVPEGINRDELVKALAEKNVESTLGTYCLSTLTYYTRKYGVDNPNASRLEKETITLPCFDGVDVGAVVSAIKSILSA